ncbi:hypothetical protein HANVADRAFT_54412 [Hanseniaspora valbyensis NRRL Y-1626]|uniref:Translation initiation factor IF2/IF5 domain-containing protein n=1 Tax=Hanseniaspora valbyensis NRRL Y-1626 TaxID=766949 RepID=A0A1B7SKH2_9ASCO|nr:hypothetical protein HANVADRAFT_54412 [Hanseniaspora valbyensis NRRL Y-1626]
MAELAAQLGIDPTLKKKKKKVIKLDDLENNTSISKDEKDVSPTPSSSVASDDITAALGDMTLKKKKKKKQTVSLDDFDKELVKAGVDESMIKEKLETPESNSEQQEVTKVIGGGYENLLSRFFKILKQNNPELAGEKSSTKFRIPPPVCQRDGKKTIFVNIEEICEKLQRSVDHLIQYLYAELGTSGSIDGQKRLIIKGKFLGKQMENVLRRYILEYVTCKTCKSINTELKKEQSNRLFFLVCKSCGSTRSVSSIKTGFQATVKRVKK